MLREGARHLAVSLQRAERFTVVVKDHVDGALHAMLSKQMGCAKPAFLYEAVCNDLVAGMKRIAGRRLKIGSDCRVADNTRVRTYPSAHKKSILALQIFQDFAEANFKPKGTKSRSFCKQCIEVGARQSP